MPRCRAITTRGEQCHAAAKIGDEYCYFHAKDPQTSIRVPPKPETREQEMLALFQCLRTARRLPASLERNRVILRTVELIEQLRRDADPPLPKDIKDLTVEERLALRGK